MDSLPNPGDVFAARYEILKLLGAGGNGAVFKALQLDCQRIIAIKIILPKFAKDEDLRNRFMREARSLSLIKHPNIVLVYHVGITDEQFLFLAMEYIEGTTLRQLLQELDKLPLERAIEIALQCARALATVHKLGIVHRDLKPENLIVLQGSGPEIVKVIDFGMAKATNDFTITSKNEIVGTFGYMSPEQCKAIKADQKSDIYSLSVCFFEMLTGGRPFESDSPLDLAAMHISAQVPTLDPKQIENFNPALNRFLQKGMAKDPAMRFLNMDEMEKALSDLEHYNWENPNPSRQRVFFQSLSEQQRLLLLLALLTIIALVAVVLIDRLHNLWQSKSANRQAETVRAADSSVPNHKVTVSEACSLCAKLEKQSKAKKELILNNYLTHAELDPRARAVLLICKIDTGATKEGESSATDALRIVRSIKSNSTDSLDNNLYLHCLLYSVELEFRLGKYKEVESLCREGEKLPSYSIEMRLPSPIGNNIPNASEFAVYEIRAALALHELAQANSLTDRLMQPDSLSPRLRAIAPILLSLKRYRDLDSLTKALGEAPSGAVGNLNNSPKSRMWAARDLCTISRLCADAAQYELAISCSTMADKLLYLMKESKDYGDVDKDFVRLHLICATQKTANLLASSKESAGRNALKSIYQWWLKENEEDLDHSYTTCLNPVHLIYLLEQEEMKTEADRLIDIISPNFGAYLSFSGIGDGMGGAAYWVKRLEPYSKSDPKVKLLDEQLKKSSF